MQRTQTRKNSSPQVMGRTPPTSSLFSGDNLDAQRRRCPGAVPLDMLFASVHMKVLKSLPLESALCPKASLSSSGDHPDRPAAVCRSNLSMIVSSKSASLSTGGPRPSSTPNGFGFPSGCLRRSSSSTSGVGWATFAVPLTTLAAFLNMPIPVSRCSFFCSIHESVSSKSTLSAALLAALACPLDSGIRSSCSVSPSLIRCIVSRVFLVCCFSCIGVVPNFGSARMASKFNSLGFRMYSLAR